MAQGRQQAWILPISAVMLAALVIAVPANLRPGAFELNEGHPGLDFDLAVTHILLAAVAIVTVCVSAWSWPRVRYPAVHRWTGRVYVATALPSALLTLPLVLLNNKWAGDVGALATGGWWFVTTLVGYVAMRRGDQSRHRRWMLYSFAMATSFVWGLVLGPLFAQPALFPYLSELIRWVGPLVNLGAAKWYLDRTAPRGMVIPLPTVRTEQADRRAA